MDLVLLDVDGTLVDHDAAERTAVTGWIAAAGLPSSDEGRSTERLWHDLSERAFVDYRAGRLSFLEQRRRRISEFLGAVGRPVVDTSDAALDRAFAEYLRRYEAAWTPYPEAAPALAEVGQHGRVAVLSNGDHDQQVDKLERTGLLGLVEAVVTSSDLGVAKPDPRCFREAARRLRVDPSRVLYCGDRLDVDARAATAAGMVGVWLDRTGVPAPDAGVAVISTLAQLPGLLGR
jgi:putative hydrolase of the HAD superfamily